MKAYIHDCDPFGIAYYSRYLEWAEESRVDEFAEEFQKVKSQGKTFIPAKMSAEYKRPIQLFDEFDIETCVSRTTGMTVDLMTKFTKNDIALATVFVTLICLDTATHKPARHGLE